MVTLAMPRDSRKHPRTPLAMTVELTFANGEQMQVSTWDISDGGVGVQLPDGDLTQWELGMSVIGQVKGLPVEGPKISMQVVQITDNRIGLKIIRDQ